MKLACAFNVILLIARIWINPILTSLLVVKNNLILEIVQTWLLYGGEKGGEGGGEEIILLTTYLKKTLLTMIEIDAVDIFEIN